MNALAYHGPNQKSWDDPPMLNWSVRPMLSRAWKPRPSAVATFQHEGGRARGERGARLPGANEVGSLNETHQMNTSRSITHRFWIYQAVEAKNVSADAAMTGALTLPLTSAS